MFLIPRIGYSIGRPCLSLRPSTISIIRYKSKLPSKKNQSSNSKLPAEQTPKKSLPSQGEWEHLKLHIPGEQVQTNTLKDRIPKFPLGKENVPTLLPRPGVPQVGKNFTFRQVISILKNKTQPELIYESEPHRLYFLMCFCTAIVFAVYGCVLLEWATWIANKEYHDNEKEETNESIRKRDWLLSLLMYMGPSCVLFLMAYGAAIFPTRIIRRVWYLPGPVEHIKFTSYPLIPGKPTPVYTVPLENLTRKKTARVWTGKGFYGTADKGFFYFTLLEKLPSGRKKSWIIDRKGFFWSDGRVFDFLFGKETLQESEAGVPYDEQFGIINRELKKKKKEMRKKHGIFWRYKMAGSEFTKDVKKLGGYVNKTIGNGNDNKKQLPPK
ncbi:hypothetical protein SBY92_005072 [Candida maltosa Xu316]|uniref:Uncharacterized protein n=1 Tax=Candida maltosa (strain Xu316) TaxID=1245528 RepID=M3J6T4_CANMX|nr:hypothetical protein G210_1768 [Candida maltosa Xu316]